MSHNIICLLDSDTGESRLDVVRVPEGVSVQVAVHGGADFVSVILSPDQALALWHWLSPSTLPEASRDV